jgi:hypothetical protein
MRVAEGVEPKWAATNSCSRQVADSIRDGQAAFLCMWKPHHNPKRRKQFLRCRFLACRGSLECGLGLSLSYQRALEPAVRSSEPLSRKPSSPGLFFAQLACP